MLLSEGFLLADEMGLGKTVMALEEVRRRAETQDDMKVLIVCPKPVIPVWDQHVKMMLPEAVVTTEGPYISEDATTVVITNYEQVRINHAYNEVYWTYVICDEAHYIKNRKAKRTRAVKRLRAKYRRALTGTPLVNRPDELWSLLNWLHYTNFRSYWAFYRDFVEYEVPNPVLGYHKILGPKNLDVLKSQMRPFTLRRLKKTVLKDLPDKYYQRIEVELTAPQARAYRQMKKESIAWIGQHENEPLPAPIMLAVLTRLRQFTTAYAELNGDGKAQLSEPSSKLDTMMELIQDTDQPIVVFSQFKQLVNLAAVRLARAGIPFVLMTGDTHPKDRGEHVERFQKGDARVFLATTQTGGVGITLTAASTCIFLDRSWSPAVNLQAEDRLHRIGQKNAVQVISLQARNTVDQVVEETLERKWGWIKQMLEGH